MNILSKILFPIAVMSIAAAGPMDLGDPVSGSLVSASASPKRDTVIYPQNSFRPKAYRVDSIIVDNTLTEEEFFDTTTVTTARLSPRDSLKALLDSTMWDKIDSIYIADSTAKAKAAFDAWYAGLSKDEKKKYDNEQKAKRKLARTDSLRTARERQKEIRDSIIAEKPRILETYALPDSLHYKRLVAWTVDQNFGKVRPHDYDTTFNYRFYDYPFLRKDVNATWLGVAGSPVQYYNYFNRKSEEDVEFYKAQEAWSYTPESLLHFNTKTPYTELAYFGTLLAGDDKSSDNLHLFTTQNITPEFNFALLYDRYGGKGILEKEETVNQNTSIQANYLGKKYTMHAAYIYNMVSRQENGGIIDNKWVHDTIVDPRDIRVHLNDAKSKIKKNTVVLDQQLRIPFNFINRIKARKDSTFVFDADSMDRDITTAFVGHSSEFSTYSRKYTDRISNDSGRDFYNNVFLYDPTASADSMRVMKLDNKVYLRLQPWASDGIISKLDVGAGDYIRNYLDTNRVQYTNHTENSFYIYAGAEGQLRDNFFWDGRAEYVLLGHDFGDFELEANGLVQFHPFRRARKSPVTLGLHFESNLKEPTYYQQHINANHYKWSNDFKKISTSEISASVDIPRWKFRANVAYGLLGNNLYYDTKGIIRQNEGAMSVLSADLRKDFKIGPLHLDNKALLQFSSNPEVLPLPTLALNLRYYLEFVVQRNEAKTKNIMVMQIGANAFYNTAWNAPSWNPNLGVFHNQNERLYTNGPYFDVFVNVQWKRACIFIKYQNAGMGWPMDKRDYFSADRYIITQNGGSGLKLGIYWPFYKQPAGQAPR